MYDIAIVGLGPAGSFLAAHLKGFKVIAIDKKQASGGFTKSCGGLLAPDAQKSLSRFNMTLPKDILVSPQIFSVRTIDLKSGLSRHYQRHYINLDRNKFDRWLINQIPSSVEIKDGATCTEIAYSGDSYKIDFIRNHKPESVRAKYVAGADGAASIVRKKLFPEFNIRSYLSISQWFADSHQTPFYSCIFDPDITDSYAWGLTKDGRFLFGGAFNIKTGKKDFEELKIKLKPYGFHLENPIETEACLALRPYLKFCTGKNGAFLVGEAAGFISPSSLEGISYAIDSGYLLSCCLNSRKKDPNSEYDSALNKIKAKLLMKNLKRPFMYNPSARKIVMQSGVSSISVLK